MRPIAARCRRPFRVVFAACALCLPLEAVLSSGQDTTIAVSGSASLAAGPDAAGYTAKDQTEPGGPAYSFVDISTTGTQLTFVSGGDLVTPTDDDGVAFAVPLGFPFRFYGATYTGVNMSTNGFLHFDLTPDSASRVNQCPMPDAQSPNNLIAVLWDDLVMRNPGTPGRGGYTQQFASCPNPSGGGGACTIFMWDNADIYGGPVVESVDVEAILYANGNILMQYGPGNPAAASSAATGLENRAGTAGLVYACNPAAPITEGRAVLFTPAPPTVASPGRLLISEFRLRGPAGANDEFIEIYNNSDVPLTVATSDGSLGYALVASSTTDVNVGSPVIEFIIPNGTIIPARGHFLGTNILGYSLSTYPAGSFTFAHGDVLYTDDIPDNTGIALFNTTAAGNFTLANRLDAVGSTLEANPIYREGAGYPFLTPIDSNYSFTRRLPGGCTGSVVGSGNCNNPPVILTTPGPATTQVQDTNNNAADFIFVATTNALIGAQRLGAPGPENLKSPLSRDGFGLTASKLDSCQRRHEAPNVVRDFTPDMANHSNEGTFDIRRTFTNTTGVHISRLRFRVVDITTFPAIAGAADLRLRSSTDVAVTVDRPPCDGLTSMVSVLGTTLEQPPNQPNGSGFNASLTVGSITPQSPLGAGTSVDVRFLLGVQITGVARFCVAAETLPATSSQILCVIGNGDALVTLGKTWGDFNADGRADKVVYRPSTGEWLIFNQPDVQFGDPSDIPVPGDYLGDGDLDIAVFRPSTGQWFVRNQFTVQWGDRGDVPVPGDFDGDGATDVAVYRPSTGQWFVRNRFTVNFGGPGGYVPVVGDYNGDGTDDVAVFQPSTGMWFIRNQGAVHFGDRGDRPVPGDYNDDGKMDIAVYRPSTGHWFVRNQFTVQWGDRGDVPVPRDYDANGATDVAVYRPSTGQWFVKNQFVATVGAGNRDRDMPVPLTPWIPLAIAGDYDGDGAADLAVHRPSTNQWFVRNQLAVSFGDPGDIPIPADYNGDRRMDVAVYRPSTGHWFVRNQPTVQFGDPSDKPVPGDYNGDGLMDVAVFRPSTGTWFVRNQFTVQFGNATDIPVPGDYNGDGVTDIAVYRPTSGQWFVRNQLALQFGDPGDIPVPADYNGDGTMDLAVYRLSTGHWFVRNQFTVQFGDPGDVAVPADYNGDRVTDIAIYRPSTGRWFVRNLFTVQFGDATYVPMVRIGGAQ